MRQIFGAIQQFMINVGIASVAPHAQIREAQAHAMAVILGRVYHHVLIDVSTAMNRITREAYPIFAAILAFNARSVDGDFFRKFFG